MPPSSKTVSIIGTGDLAKALGKRLLSAGYSVCFGSRSPHKRNLAQHDDILRRAHVTRIEDSLAAARIVILAINVEHHGSLRVYKDLLVGKVLVDVSNGRKKNNGASLAEELAVMFPASDVVKAFNTLSAYAIGSDIAGESKSIQVCGDSVEAKAHVLNMAREMGFQPVDVGGLQMARKLEAIPLYLFRGWGSPCIMILLIFLLWSFYIIISFFVMHSHDEHSLDRLPGNLLNKSMASSSITLLALVYLAGCIAAFTQIIYGTKQKRFPDCLDLWLKMRKQLGLFALLFAAMHMVLSVVVMTPGYLPWLFIHPFQEVSPNVTVVIATDTRMNWEGELVILLGVLALAGMAILGITSIPAVGSFLNWREWICVQSEFGWVCFVVAIGHVMVRGAPGWHYAASFTVYVQRTNFLSLLIPWLTLFLKIILLLPCIKSYVVAIRRGWERGKEVCIKNENGFHKPGHNKPLTWNNVVTGYGNSHTNPSFDFDIENGHKETETKF